MATYYITETPRSNPEKRVLSQFVYTIVFLVLFDVASRIANGRWIYSSVLAIVGTVFFVGNLLTSFLWKEKPPSYALAIDDYGIRMLWNGKAIRKVPRERVGYVGEWGSGRFRKLVISQHGPLFTRWLWGGIGVPASLPEYEQIKAELLSWPVNPNG